MEKRIKEMLNKLEHLGSTIDNLDRNIKDRLENHSKDLTEFIDQKFREMSQTLANTLSVRYQYHTILILQQ